MQNLLTFSWLLIFAVTLFFTKETLARPSADESEKPAPRAFLCPNDAAIAPCACDPEKEIIRCETASLNNSQIANAINLIRAANALQDGEYLTFYSFLFGSPALQELDLTPFLYTSFRFLASDASENLKSIVGPPLTEATRGKIDVEELYVYRGRLNEEGIGESLKYFSATGMRTLDFTGNVLQGPKDGEIRDGEFLPGMSSFINLRSFKIHGNNVNRLVGRPFWNNTKLDYLEFSQNQISEISGDAFDFNPEGEGIDVELNIHMQECSLRNEAFPQGGLGNFSRPVYVWFDLNRIEYLEQSRWEAFFDHSSSQRIRMINNPLFCDPRMRWIKDRTAVYQDQISWALCENDPGYDVFSSDLV